MPEDIQNPEQYFSTQGNPFKSEAAAKKFITERGLDPGQFHPVSHEDGYIVKRRAQVQVPEKYYRVMFSHKQNPHDERDVTLTVNGETLVIQRGVEVIIPSRFKECADHATYAQFTQKPNEPRKVVGTIMVFPYSLVGEATESEYRSQLADGNKRTKQELEKARKLVS